MILTITCEPILTEPSCTVTSGSITSQGPIQTKYNYNIFKGLRRSTYSTVKLVILNCVFSYLWVTVVRLSIIIIFFNDIIIIC